MEIKKILVTGGAGYIGSHLVDRLVELDYQVTVLDSLVPQVHRSGDWPQYTNESARYVRGDILDRETFQMLAVESDAVVHFAAAVSVGQSMYEIDRYVQVNTRGTALLWDILVNEKHQVKKVIVASSVGVFGEGAYHCKVCGPSNPGLRSGEQLEARQWEPVCDVCRADLEPVPTSEEKPLFRDNVYSMTKLHQEELSLLLGRTYGIPTVTPRFFNVYGPRQSLSNPYAGVAAIFLSRLLNDKTPVVFEDGGQLRDFVFITDVVDCLVLMLEQSGADFLPVNVGSGRQITILEIARTLARLTGKTIEPDVSNTGRRFDIRHCFADITRAQKLLGYVPKVSFEQGMIELINWSQSGADPAVDLFDVAMSELQKHGLMAKPVK